MKMMKIRRFVPLALLVLVSAGLGSASTSAPAGKVTGDYVEARTASVFAGACHYNGEIVTTGCDAIMAWNISSGAWKGTDLAGLRAMAAVTSEANLGNDHAGRKCELLIDSSASAAQSAAFADLLHSQYGAHLGDIVGVRRGDVSFKHSEDGYSVKSEGFGEMSVQPMPDAGCCKQPNLVWYSPLMTLQNRKVGYTELAKYSAATLADPWQRSDENDAFYGTFAY